MMQESYTSPVRDKLFAATQIMPVVPGKVTIAKGVVAKRGAIVTAAGALATAAADCYAILAIDVDATDAAKEAAVYFTGEFNVDALSVGGSIAAADCEQALRKIGIFLKKNIAE